MADKTLTGANAVLMLGVTGLVDVPQRIQGFATDDVYDVAAINSAETVPGVDGKLSAGWIYVPIEQGYTLQADSDSIDFFEQLYSAQQQVQETYRLFGSVYLPSVQRVYTMTRGILTNYNPMPTVKKIIQPRKFSIVWEAVTAGPL
jgi:hypothetical protein